MGNKIRTLITADYMQKFNCIGSACEDNCCHSWSIQVEDDTYLKYKNYKGDKELEDLFNTGIFENDDRHLMELDENKNCIFLDKDRLCKIHKNLGEDMLCIICKTYPKHSTTIGTEGHLAGALSCPEVARLALLNKDGMQFFVSDIEVELESSCNIHPNLENYYEIIQRLTLTILKNRNYTIESRLCILWVLFDRLDKNINMITDDFIQEVIKDFTKNERLEMLFRSFKEFKLNVNYQHKYYTFLLLELLDKDKKEIEGNINILYLSKEVCSDNDVEKYEKLLVRYKSIIDEYEYILENYLVNFAFLKCVPFSKDMDFKSGYANLVTSYFLLRSVLITLIDKEDICEASFIEVIYKFERIINHGNVSEKLLDLIKKDNKFELNHYMLMLNI